MKDSAVKKVGAGWHALAALVLQLGRAALYCGFRSNSACLSSVSEGSSPKQSL
jgi:hypothetical protein